MLRLEGGAAEHMIYHILHVNFKYLSLRCCSLDSKVNLFSSEISFRSQNDRQAFMPSVLSDQRELKKHLHRGECFGKGEVKSSPIIFD